MNAFFETHDEHFVAIVHRDMTFPLHLHSQFEVYMLLSGSARVQVQQDVHVLHTGDIAIVFPNQIHSYQALEADTESALIISALELTGGYTQTLLNFYPACAFIRRECVHRDVYYAMQTLAEENREDSAANAPLIQLILARLMPCITLLRNTHTGKTELVNQVVQYIALHFREMITLEGLATALGVSKYHLSHLFSERIQESFPSYLANIRLNYACSKLRDTVLSVTQIAMDAGFDSQRTFYRVFRQKLGMTPVEYRKNALMNREKQQ